MFGIGYKTLPYTNFLGSPVVADNMYLSLLVETGVAGMLALIWLNFAILRAAAQRSHSFFGMWMLCFWAGQTVQFASGDLLTYWRVLPVYFWILALAAACMNLLLLDQFSDPGGAQKNLLDLLPAIRAAGWQTLVGIPGEGALFEQVRALGFEAEAIECGPYGSGRKSAGRFRPVPGRDAAVGQADAPHGKAHGRRSHLPEWPATAAGGRDRRAGAAGIVPLP